MTLREIATTELGVSREIVEAFDEAISSQDPSIELVGDTLNAWHDAMANAANVLTGIYQPTPEEAEADAADAQEAARAAVEVYRTATRSLGLAIANWYARQKATLSPSSSTSKTPLRPPARLPAVVKHDASNIYRAATYALAHAPHWNALGEFAYGIERRYSDTQIVIGVPSGDHAETYWEFLRKGGVQSVKANSALWARWYAEDGELVSFISIDIAQFCADIGYKRHVKGGYRIEQKREAKRLLEALTSVEISAYFTNPKTKKVTRLRGPLWQRGILQEEHDGYVDLFGAAREGTSDLWEPVRFSFAPGQWFENAEWRKYGHHVGKLSAGLLQLSNDTDQWAILIGGYLSTEIRTNAYRPITRRIETILERCDLAQSADARRKRAVNEGRFYDALEKLQEAGVIASYTTQGFDVSDVDMDDPEALAAYGSANPNPRKDWRARSVTISFPSERDMERLATARLKAGAPQKPKRGRPKKRTEGGS